MNQVMPLADAGTGLLQFGASFVRSDAFKALFREGMSLVEETANYLDGEGRISSQNLGRSASLTYASESMRLTTRLMQVASWLLVHRAVAEGEITSLQAKNERERVKLVTNAGPADGSLDRLPEPLRNLIEKSQRLHARVVHLDAIIAEAATDKAEPAARTCPVAAQQTALREAFCLAS